MKLIMSSLVLKIMIYLEVNLNIQSVKKSNQIKSNKAQDQLKINKYNTIEYNLIHHWHTDLCIIYSVHTPTQLILRKSPPKSLC